MKYKLQSLPAWAAWIEILRGTISVMKKLVAARMGSVD